MKKLLLTASALSLLFCLPSLAKTEYGGEISRSKKLYPSLKNRVCKETLKHSKTCEIDRIRVIGQYVWFGWWTDESGGTTIEKWNGKNWVALIGGPGALDSGNAIRAGVPKNVAEILVPVICPIYETKTTMLKSEDISNCSEWDLLVSRNLIYARHGRAFTYKPLKDYFLSFEWYLPNPKYHDDMLDAIEKHNVKIIQDMEKSKGLNK